MAALPDDAPCNRRDSAPSMLVYLVTGVSGAGKSTVARRLRDWGHEAVSLDADTRLCSWLDEAGCRVDRPAEPGMAWLTTHRWMWDPVGLDGIITEAHHGSVGVLWLCGRADNAVDLTDRFDAVFLLDIDQNTMRQRLSGSSRGNDFGRRGDTLEFAVASHTTVLATWRRHGAHTIDATQPLDRVVEDLLMAGARAKLHLQQGGG